MRRGSTRHPLSERYELVHTVFAAWRVDVYVTIALKLRRVKGVYTLKLQ